MRAGLLGRKLGHSFSPEIHAKLGSYSYDLFEVEPNALEDFIRNGAFDALNVTMPYKKTLVPYCTELTDAAEKIGCVNVIVRKGEGRLLGDNTDAAGFEGMLKRLGVDIRGKKALVLGSGGASLAARYVLGRYGAEIVTVSRSGENNYEDLQRHADAALIVNATPVGMFPKNGERLVELERFPALEGVLDMIYNPLKTQLMLDAEKRGIPAEGGLYMLVEQARRASEDFTGTKIDPERTEEIYADLLRARRNIVILGMPGSGKTTVGRLVAEKTGREFVDADAAIEEKLGVPIPIYFADHCEDEFRRIETQVLAELGRRSGIVLATGGGCVTRRENYDPLHQNGRLFCLRRDVELLPTDGRPLSREGAMQAMYEKRLPMYRAFADVMIENDASPEQAAERILEALS